LKRQRKLTLSKPPKRKRKRDTRSHSAREYHTSIVIAAEPPTMQHERYSPMVLPRYPDSNGLVRFKISNKWIGGEHATSGMYVPLINKIGLITPRYLGIWKCSYHDFFTTLVSTIYKRLSRSMWVYWRRAKCRPTDFQLYQVAFIYASEQNDYWFKRTYGLLKHNPLALVSHIYKKICTMDAPIRFLYAQMQQCISWVQHRSPLGRRVKSIPSNWFYTRPELLEYRSCIVPERLDRILSHTLRDFSTRGAQFSWKTRASLFSKRLPGGLVLFHGTNFNGGAALRRS